jgi:hypothetical protein
MTSLNRVVYLSIQSHRHHLIAIVASAAKITRREYRYLHIRSAQLHFTRGATAQGESVSIQANIDFNQLIAELPKLGFAGSVPQNAASDSSQDCSQNSTGYVREFLAKNQCKEYAVTLVKLHKQGIATQTVISWVVMATPSLTFQYKNLVDERYKGNAPGQPTNFDGLCYASGQDNDAAWVAQVQPTGRVTVDRQILQAVSPAKLSASYLEMHCVA